MAKKLFLSLQMAVLIAMAIIFPVRTDDINEIIYTSPRPNAALSPPETTIAVRYESLLKMEDIRSGLIVV